jgi:hypothetical protein
MYPFRFSCFQIRPGAATAALMFSVPERVIGAISQQFNGLLRVSPMLCVLDNHLQLSLCVGSALQPGGYRGRNCGLEERCT